MKPPSGGPEHRGHERRCRADRHRCDKIAARRSSAARCCRPGPSARRRLACGTRAARNMGRLGERPAHMEEMMKPTMAVVNTRRRAEALADPAAHRQHRDRHHDVDGDGRAERGRRHLEILGHAGQGGDQRRAVNPDHEHGGRQHDRRDPRAPDGVVVRIVRGASTGSLACEVIGHRSHDSADALPPRAP